MVPWLRCVDDPLRRLRAVSRKRLKSGRIVKAFLERPKLRKTAQG
jgi:hypothetical protein